MSESAAGQTIAVYEGEPLKTIAFTKSRKDGVVEVVPKIEEIEASDEMGICKSEVVGGQ